MLEIHSLEQVSEIAKQQKNTMVGVLSSQEVFTEEKLREKIKPVGPGFIKGWVRLNGERCLHK